MSRLGTGRGGRLLIVSDCTRIIILETITMYYVEALYCAKDKYLYIRIG